MLASLDRLANYFSIIGQRVKPEGVKDRSLLEATYYPATMRLNGQSAVYDTNGSKALLSKLGVSNGLPIFLLYRAIRRLSLSPMIPVSLGL